MGGAASYLQNAVVALSSKFGPMHLQGILSGQGAIGLLVASVQLFAALAAGRLVPPHHPNSYWGSVEGPIPSTAIREASFSFFLAVLAFVGTSFAAHQLLIQLPLYRLVIRSSHPTISLQHPKRVPSLRVVERKIRSYNLMILYVFMITLCVFPAVTSTITSVHDPRKGGKGGLGEILSSTEIFVPLAFIFFAAGDWIGRTLPQYVHLFPFPFFLIEEPNSMGGVESKWWQFVPRNY